MRNIEKIVKITQSKKDPMVLRRAIELIKKSSKYIVLDNVNELHLFDDELGGYVASIAVTNFDALVLYVMD